jgi:hypothetical protein
LTTESIEKPEEEVSGDVQLVFVEVEKDQKGVSSVAFMPRIKEQSAQMFKFADSII